MNSTLRNQYQWNVYGNSHIFIDENACEDVVSLMAAILSRPQYVEWLIWTVGESFLRYKHISHLLTSKSQSRYTTLLFAFARHCYVAWWRHQIKIVSALLAIWAGNSPVTGEFPAQGQWRAGLMFSLMCVWINGWVNNREAGDLRRYRAHYDVILIRSKLRGLLTYVLTMDFLYEKIDTCYGSMSMWDSCQYM